MSTVSSIFWLYFCANRIKFSCGADSSFCFFSLSFLAQRLFERGLAISLAHLYTVYYERSEPGPEPLSMLWLDN